MDERFIFNELRKGLEKVTEKLNKKRGLWNKYIAGQKFLFHTERDVPMIGFQIRTEYRNGREGLCAEIKIGKMGLEGEIVPAKKHAKPICSYLHAFSHEHNINLGSLAHLFNKYL